MAKHIELSFRLTEYDEAGEEVVRDIRLQAFKDWQQLTANKGAFKENEIAGFNKLLTALRELAEAE